MRLDRVAGALALSGGIIHGGLTGAHLGEWWGYGLFFLVAAAAQSILGLALLMDAYEGARDRRMVLWAGLVGNAFVAVVYLVSRTSGVPLGPDAGVVQPVDALGLATLAAEVLLVLVLAGTLWNERGATLARRTS